MKQIVVHNKMLITLRDVTQAPCADLDRLWSWENQNNFT